MEILRALRFPLRRPLRLVALALAQSLFLWLMIVMIAAFDATYSRPNDFEGIVILLLFFGSLLCSAFWLHGSSVASLQRALAGHNALAPQRASHFKPRGIGPVVTSLVLMVYFFLFLALVAVPAQVLWHLRVITPDEALSLIASHVLVLGLGTLVSLMFFVSLARYAAEGAGLHIDARSAGLFHPFENLAAMMRFLFRQFLLLGMAAIAFDRGLELVSAITPRDMRVILDDPFATTWWFIVIFAGSAVVHYFWHASLYLLADYVVQTGTSNSL